MDSLFVNRSNSRYFKIIPCYWFYVCNSHIKTNNFHCELLENYYENLTFLWKSHIFCEILTKMWDFGENLTFWKSHILVKISHFFERFSPKCEIFVKISYSENLTFWKYQILEISHSGILTCWKSPNLRIPHWEKSTLITN